MTDPSQAPFFSARKHAGGVTVRGDLSCRLGHTLPSQNGTGQDGIFAGWTWDGHTLAVENDRYGVYPLFYSSGPGEIALSTSLVRLLEEGASLEVDAGALAVFLHLGFFIGNDTPFRHVKVVPPNVSFTWNGSLEVQETRHVGGTLEISRNDAIEEYVRLFRLAVARRLPAAGDFAVPLSGGRDSRHILLELCALGRRPTYCITGSYYGLGHNDLEIARLVTTALGLPHVVVDQIPRIEAELRKNVATSFCADEHAWLVPVGDHLTRTVETIYDGMGGDVLSASLFQHRDRLDLYRTGRLKELADALVGRSSDRLQRTLDPAFRAEGSTALARDRVLEELERYATAANPVTMFFFWNRTRREIALSPFGISSGVKTCFCPYLDHELFDFLASLPPEVTLDKRFHTQTIGRAHPAFAKLPYAEQLRGWTTPATAGLLGRTMWYGLRTRPARIGRFGRVAAQRLRFALRSSYRRRNRALPPAHLLYLCQLEDLRRELSSRYGRRT